MKLFFLLLLLVADLVTSGDHDATQTICNRATMVHLFEWKWTDIAKECENFLQYYGYGAVQVSPPQEHVTLQSPANNRPWWIRYQPVSYLLDNSRSGTRAQFIDMVQRCNKVGVRVIVDAVINHMTCAGEVYGKNGVGDTDTNYFNGTPFYENFPAAGYVTSDDFNDKYCNHDIQNFNNPWEVRTCRLGGKSCSLLDLNQGVPIVRTAITNYFTEMVNIGIAGLRVDAAKHMWPGDLKAIYDATGNLNSSVFGPNQRMFITQEITDGGAVTVHDYTDLGRVMSFDYGPTVAAAVKRSKNFQYFGTLGPSWFQGGLPDNDALNFIDNHDTQHHDGLPLTYKDGSLYVMAVSFMLAWPYGYPRVMSSYYFTYSDQGPPSTGSPNYYTTSPTFHADKTCQPQSGWVCEHRWPAIRHMVQFRSVTMGEPVLDIVTRDQSLGFRRGTKGFFMVNNGYDTWASTFQTGLPAGTYCDVISGTVSNGGCTGQTVVVALNGKASVAVSHRKTFAIHLYSRNQPYMPPPAPTPNSQWQSTVVFLYMQTNQGPYAESNLAFICPIINNGQTTQCAIPIIHQTKVASAFRSYTDWSKGDYMLDWNGEQPGQGQFTCTPAAGTPLVYSTNDVNAAGYQPLNKYGPSYWMVQMNMDCSQTISGWFEFKGFEQNGVGFEHNIGQTACGGSVGGRVPFSSINHIAKCGAVNVFIFNSNTCTINTF